MDRAGPRRTRARTGAVRAPGPALGTRGDPGTARGTAHAYGHLGTTLCGAGYDGLTASPYPWVPGWSSACPDCEEAAAVIDRRRPAEARDENEKRNRPLSQPGSNGLPF
ncbi:hypothetical protein [Streptomyces cinereoruber]|uniref:hypothetical protein n=1 Tax=Streptomyces cinereoruber TaxID=67260 RepID=UPI00363747C5